MPSDPAAVATPSTDPLNAMPLILGAQSPYTLTHSLLAPIFRPASRLWWAAVLLMLAGTAVFFFCAVLTVKYGIGMWGNNMPVAWAFGITNFVWWIGFGHAGTLISAILVLFQQQWRASINRFAEAMTLFAVMQAGLFPLLHLGRPWFFYWLVPYPSTHGIWPQFRSSLPWDVVAISTYFTISLVFWFMGLLPDLAAARDHAPTRARRLAYGVACLGWRNSARHWHHYQMAYLLVAALATPLVVSVHTIVSFDFAISQLPGWHTTIFPPYFVAGAIFSGLGLVLFLVIPARALLGFGHVVTARHIDVLNRLLVATSLMVAYGYLQEHFFAWYSGDVFEEYAFRNRRSGPWGWLFYLQILFNVLLPQLLWVNPLRRSLAFSWLVALLVCVGMWIERFNIIVVSLTRDFLPSSWGTFRPTLVDLGLLFGSICFFNLLFLLFLKLVPFIPISEVKELHQELRKAPGVEKSGVSTGATGGAS